jgi:3-mercaptopyruvate sulfurtransferase SseA
VALQLRKAGIKHVRPLQGGLDGWRASGYPVEALTHDVVLAANEDGLLAGPNAGPGSPPDV